MAELIDRSEIVTTLTTEGGPLSTQTLRRAHETIESGASIGKIVLTGFGDGA